MSINNAKIIFRNPRDPNKYLNNTFDTQPLHPKSLLVPSSINANQRKLNNFQEYKKALNLSSGTNTQAQNYSKIIKQFPGEVQQQQQMFKQVQLYANMHHNLFTPTTPDYNSYLNRSSDLEIHNHHHLYEAPKQTAQRAIDRQKKRIQMTQHRGGSYIVEKMIGPRPDLAKNQSNRANIPTPIAQPAQNVQLFTQPSSVLMNQFNQVSNFIMGKRFLPTTIGTSQISPSDPHGRKNRIQGRVNAPPSHQNISSVGYCSSSQQLENEQAQRYKFEMRQADKNSPPKRVVPISKAQPNSNKKQQQIVKLNGRFIIDTNATNSIMSKELPPEKTKRAEGAIKALNSALNQSSLTFFQQKRSISRNINNQTVIQPPSSNFQPSSRDNNTTDPLIDTKIPQVTYLAETSSLGSGSRIMAAPATSTKQPALILQPTGNVIPPPSTAPLANNNINLPITENNANHDDKMNITTTTMFQRSKQLSKPDQLKPQTRRSQQSFIQSKFLNTQNQSVVQQATTEEAQKLMISASDENIVQGLEPGEHYIKLMPNDYWEFYKQHIQSFKKHDHGIKQPRRSLLAPANRTAIPLDLAKVQNTAFKKMMPKNDSDATLQFQKQFLWNQQAEDRKRWRDQQKLAALINSSDQSIKKQQSDLASFKQQSLSANQSQKSKPFKTSKFPITQNLEMHPEVLVPIDKVSYLRFQDQIGPCGDPKRIIGSPGKVSRGMAQTLANWNVGQRLATSNHPERLRTAVTSQMKMQQQSRTNSPLMRQRRLVNEETTKAKQDRTGFGEVNPFEQERQYMKDWMLGRMYTRIEWVMQEADQRCKCCNRIHCLNKKKSREAIYQGRRNISQQVAKEHSPLLSPKSDEKIANSKLNNPRDIISATSGSNSRSIPFTPVSIQNAMIRAQGYQQQRNFLKLQGQNVKNNPQQSSQQFKKEETEKKTSSQSLNSRMIQVNPQQLVPFGNGNQTQQLPNES